MSAVRAPAPPARRPSARALAVALVIKRSQWRIQLEERHDPRLRRLVALGDRSIAPLRASHEAHEKTVAEVRAALETVGARVAVTRRAGEPFDATGLDLVVTVGGDGTLLSASHSVDDVPILGINSAPDHSIGFFCGARSGGALAAIERAARGELRRTVLTRMKVSVDGEVVAARVLNDALFCHASPAATTRYVVELGDVKEQQKSSGFWIGPAAGSTAAQRSAGGRVLPLTSKKLQLVVREPYTPHGESYDLRHALIEPGDVLIVRSKTHDAKLFFDGPERSIDVGYGQRIEFTQAPQSLTVLGLTSKRKWGT
ncbi:MAG TPA: NAD(+)/NADH kinase [Minicystis sp.]|nr:NAD(+)/NADH kinase [Minicystis sp.]